MKTCSNCGCNDNSDTSKFCKRCGQSLHEEETVWCFNCGNPVKANEKYCTYCGMSQWIEEDEDWNPEEPQRKSPVKLIIAIIAALLIIAGIGVVIVLWQMGFLFDDEEERKPERETQFIKDEEEERAEEVAYDYPIILETQQVASSTEMDDRFDVSFLQDKDANTAWAEGVAGQGNGEYIVFSLDKVEQIYGIAILPGYFTSEDMFYDYSYPDKFVVNADGKEKEVELGLFIPDFYDMKTSLQKIDFEEPIETDELIVYIEDVQLGESYDISAISEMYLYTYPSEDEVASYDESEWEIVKSLNEDASSQEAVSQGGMLPNSDSEYLTKSDLAGMTKEECRIARNEIYARHGRKFEDAELTAYFSQFDWYEPTIDGDDFDDDMLNKYEIANRDLIVEYEEDQGYR